MTEENFLKYPAVLHGPDVCFDKSQEGRLTSAPWLQVDDITEIPLENLPARWQNEFVKRWHQYKPGGGLAVLARCRELIEDRLAVTPDDPSYGFYRRDAWLCGVLEQNAVPVDLLNYQAHANHYRPGQWEIIKIRFLRAIGFYFPDCPVF